MTEVDEMLEATDELRAIAIDEQRMMYSKLRTERERTTFAVMMKMTSEALNNVRKEFFMREDSVDLHEFVYIIQKHLSGRGPATDERFEFASKEKQEFALNVYELFNEIDVNGDGGCEWMEFTQFVVDKASFLNKKLKVTTVPLYYESTPVLDPSSQTRHRHEMTKMVDMACLGHIAVAEEQQNRIFILDARNGAYIENHKGDIKTEASPISMAFVEEPSAVLVASLANMTIATYSVDDPNVVRNYSTLSTWATPGVQMALTYMPKTRLLYSGATNGSVYAWDIKERKIKETLSGHSDIVMSLVTLSKLNYVASGSFDKTVSIWDAYTNQQLLKLYGHKKGIVGMDYAADYRLLVTAGFEHDACMWSPFVSSCVFRLKGHHAPLVGCQAVKHTPEVITADQSGIIKIWDIRNFQCIQSFSANISGRGAKVKDGSKLGAFVRCDIPTKNNYGAKKNDDARIYVASKLICAYDQTKEVTSPTTDAYGVLWTDWVGGSLTIVTVSERNVTIWDTILGSRKNVLANICGNEITACCLDDRKRKIIIGDVTGAIGVYNPGSGVLMKQCPLDHPYMVVALRYVDEPRHFFAGYQNGMIRLYDESGLDQCRLLLSFDRAHFHRELLHSVFNDHDETFTTVGHAEGGFKMWDSKSGKCEANFEICGTYDHVVQIEYLVPHSSLVVSDSIGNVTIFSYTKGAKWMEKRISGFHNHTPTRAESEMVEIPRDEDDEPRPGRAMFTIDPDDDVVSVSSKEDTNRRGRIAPVHSHPSVVPFSTSIDQQSLLGSRDASDNEGEEEDDPFKDTDDMIDALNFLERKATEDAVRKDIKHSEEKWGKVTPAQAFAWDATNLILYTGDTMGNLRSFCLRDVIGDASMRRASYLPTTFTKIKKSHPRSAMPPFPQKDVLYAMGMKADATAYLGVKFNWAVEAHEACMLHIRVAPESVLTSATDCLVRMWSHEGVYMGVLIESIPEGVKSYQWLFEADVQGAIEKETAQVSDLVDKVQTLLHDTEKPELESNDFYGLSKGQEAPEFTQSELRKRISETSAILGVAFDFTEKREASILGSDFDEESFKSLSQTSTGRLGGNAASELPPSGALTPVSHGIAAGIGHQLTKVLSNLSIANYSQAPAPTTAPLTKHFGAALTELRSSDPADVTEKKSRHLSEIEMRRKVAKIEELARVYEAKAGILIGQFYDASNNLTEVSRQLDGEGVQYLAGRSTGKKVGTGQRQIKSGMVYKVENEHDIGITQLLSHDMSMTERKEREKTANDDLYRLFPPVVSGPSTAPQSTNRSTPSARTHAHAHEHDQSGKKKLLSASQAAKLAFAGHRNQVVFDSCKKFSAFQALEDTLTKTDSKKIHQLTEEERDKLEKQRDERLARAVRRRSTMRRGNRSSGSMKSSGGSPSNSPSRSPSAVGTGSRAVSREGSLVDLTAAGETRETARDTARQSTVSVVSFKEERRSTKDGLSVTAGGLTTGASVRNGSGRESEKDVLDSGRLDGV